MKLYKMFFVLVCVVSVFFALHHFSAVSEAKTALSEEKTGFPFLFALPEKKYLLSDLHGTAAPVERRDSVANGAVPLVFFTGAMQVLREKCMPCHTGNYTVPLYGKIPGLGDIVERDYKEGLRHVNFASELSPGWQGKPVGEVFIAKIERALEDSRMPPPQYITAYLSAQLNAEEKTIIHSWIHDTRQRHYATGLASPEFSTEPVQPLPDSIPVDKRKVDLGSRLFHDPRLSGDNATTCASCHFLNRSAADDKETPRGVRGNILPFNSPTVFNAAFFQRQFWNGRGRDLQEQALEPPSNPFEMSGGDWSEICARLSRSSEFAEAFLKVYPDGITALNVTDALAEFEKTLITPNARFDRYLKGDKSAITQEEKEGYEVFKTSRCATCHVGKAMGGQSVEYLNLKADFYGARKQIPRIEDLGLYNHTKREEDTFKFKVPTLRNVTETGPWYHDGKIISIHEAVYLMGIYQSGFQLDDRSVNLIVSFLGTLIGEFRGKPVRR